MRIGPAELVEDGETVLIRSLVEYRNTKDCLWYSVDKIYAEYLTREKLDAFLVGLLPLAMKIGEDIVLEGPVSKRLFYNLSNYYMRIVGSAFPHRGAVTITPASLDDGGSYDCAGAVVTGFSGGVDAFCTFREHHYRNLLPGYRLTHLLFSNVGSFWGGDTQRARALFNRRFELVKGLGEEAGLEFVKVDSNLSEVLRMRFVEAHPARNTSVALALQGLFGVFYYSSSFTYEDCTARNPYDVGQCDPMAMHLLSTESLQCISTCGQYSRVEKTRLVAALPEARRYLNVCISKRTDGKNCSECPKCCRTLLTLEMLGKLDDFAEVFDLARYRQARNRFLTRILLRKRSSSYFAEIIELARQVGFTFPLRCVVGAYMLNLLPHPIVRWCKRLRPDLGGGPAAPW